MAFPYFSHNGEILSVEQATVPLSRVEYSYGFGVYETIRVTNGRPYFLDDHCERLMASAKVIGLDHNFNPDFVHKNVLELIERNKPDACNVKILLIGGPAAEDATLDILCLNPLFPDRQLYKTGAVAITFKYEREYPAAKTLNMLSSYLAYRQARAAGAYDALLVNRRGYLAEGTRTNFFALNGRTIISPPGDQILPGVTRAHMLQVARQLGFRIIEQDIPLASLEQFDCLFITSTSSKILPLRQVDEIGLKPISPALHDLMQAFSDYLATYPRP